MFCTTLDVFSAGLRPDGVCPIVRPAPAQLADVFPMHQFGLELDKGCQARLLRDGGGVRQRLLDAVVERVADLCERRGARLTLFDAVEGPVAQNR